jgi:hypothetical protein
MARKFNEDKPGFTEFIIINICKPVKLLRALGAGFVGLQNQHYAVF